jgi:hypothetical protein
MKRAFFLSLISVVIIGCTALKVNTQSSLVGAWQNVSGTIKEVLVFQDGYFSYTKYDQTNKQFIETKGGDLLLR